MNLIVTINSNREIVAERWAHLWQDAGISGRLTATGRSIAVP